MTRESAPMLAAHMALMQHLREAAEAATTTDMATMNRLRSAVFEITRALRNDGFPPEKTLVAVKEVSHGRILGSTARTSDWSGDKIRSAITSWCIEEYFREPVPDGRGTMREQASQRSE